jgi:hypothetical protein
VTAALAISPTSGNITAKLTACNISCSDEPNNDDGNYDADSYPTEPQIVYHFKLSTSGQDDLVSNPFSTNPDGAAEWPSVLFPAAGTWTLALIDESDDSTITSTSVTVS